VAGADPEIPKEAVPTGHTAEATDADFTDLRRKGDFASHYTASAWLQISLEGLYLVAVAIIAGVHILGLALNSRFVEAEIELFAPALGSVGDNGQSVRLWMTVFCAGVLGATTFSFKWLYHGVAWKEWHRDRLVWRLVVPLQGGLLAVFTGCMIIAGIVPLLSKETFQRLATAAGYGYLVGLFADNFLAALQRLAKRLLGTLGQSN